MNNEHQTYPSDNEQNYIIIYRSKDGKVNVALMTREGKVWLNQMQIAKLFGTSKQSVSHHIAGVLKDNELGKDAVVKYYLTTASDGRNYKVLYYSLEMILAIGYRVRGVRGVQFRQWATQHLSEYLVKGFTMDDERLKILTVAQTISMSCCNVSAISELRKSDFIRSCVTCLS